jgi:hypothetical protein
LDEWHGFDADLSPLAVDEPAFRALHIGDYLI